MSKLVFAQGEELKAWITVEEMAKHLGIGRSTAYELVRQDGFPCIKIGRIIRVSRLDLYNWLESHCVSNEQF